ncbi:MAG TPA: type II secretion system protein [Phycisphaerae bacterium]|nr:type II secretion system protein [Phycisphaerae bacterium]
MKTAAPARRGFTLIELLVVMGILGLLVMLLMPAVNYAILVAYRVATQQTIGRIEAGLAGFQADFGCYPPSDYLHEFGRGTGYATVRGYENLAEGLCGPAGTGWGANTGGNNVPSGGTSTDAFGPYFEGGTPGAINDAFKPSMAILYYRYEPARNPPFDFFDNKDMGFTQASFLNLLVKRPGSGQYVRTDYVLISAGPDRRFGYWVGPDVNGNYTAATNYTGAYCDDVTNFKYE